MRLISRQWQPTKTLMLSKSTRTPADTLYCFYYVGENIQTGTINQFLQLLRQKHRHRPHGLRDGDPNRSRADGLQQYSRRWREGTDKPRASTASKLDECFDVVALSHLVCENKHRRDVQNDECEDIGVRDSGRSSFGHRERGLVLRDSKNPT